MGRVARLKKLIQAPFNLHKHMVDLVNAEAERARAGGQGRIIAKMNSLVEPELIQALYSASQAGVVIDLIVRGVCCLRPGLEGVSDNITVRSIIGRFLEHTRIFYFENGDEEELLYLSSADWMDRNFFRRVETCFPIEDRRLRQRIIQESLQGYLTDNAQAWLLQADGTYRRVSAGNARRRSAQESLLKSLAERA